MSDFALTDEEVIDIKDMEERYKLKKWSEKYPILDCIGFIIFAPIFKLIESFSK